VGYLLYNPRALELNAYIPAGLAILCAVGFTGVFIALAALIGPKRTYAEKEIPYEAGSDPIGSPRARHSVKFYQVALLFLVFDIAAAFMYPWAIVYRDLSTSAAGGVSLFGFALMLVFVSVLVVALTYVWRKKAIGWD
jgi:NADH-quinone oxidoreductase subunit A